MITTAAKRETADSCRATQTKILLYLDALTQTTKQNYKSNDNTMAHVCESNLT
jgi:hypothetical protein